MGDRVRVQFPVRDIYLGMYNQPSRSIQPGHPFVGSSNEYQPKGDDALRLGSKGKYGLKLCDTLESLHRFASAIPGVCHSLTLTLNPNFNPNPRRTSGMADRRNGGPLGYLYTRAISERFRTRNSAV